MRLIDADTGRMVAEFTSDRIPSGELVTFGANTYRVTNDPPENVIVTFPTGPMRLMSTIKGVKQSKENANGPERADTGSPG